MAKVTVIFVGGKELLDQVIEGVTHGTCSHTAIKILGGVLESKGVPDEGDRYPGVHLHALDKYDHNQYAQFIEVEVPNLMAAERKARKLIGRFYSYIGCVEGGTYDLFGVELHPWVTRFINLLIVKFSRFPVNIDTGEWTMNCSETVTRILRAGGLNVLPGVDADSITPEDLRIALNGLEPSKIYNVKGTDNMNEESKTTEVAATTAITTSSSVRDAAEDAAKEAAKDAISNTADVITSVAADSSKSLLEKANEKISALTKEIGTTKSEWVKIRNTAEIGMITVLIAGASAGLTQAVEELSKKVK